MDLTRAFEVVTSRIKELEPQELAMKIVGFLLLQCGKEEMIRLAHGPDQAIENAVQTVKNELSRLMPKAPISPPVIGDFNPWGYSSPIAIQKPMPNLNAPVLNDLADLQTELSNMSLADQDAFGNRGARISRSLPDFPTKQCHYFRRGFCKYGFSCPYSHDDGRMFLLGPLEELEMEITHLLKMRGGRPIPLSTLPGLYADTYGRALQADGYLTESQRNGKAGYGLAKLLARMSNSICVIDRPHGQHSIILAEDVPKYLEFRSGRNNPGPIVSGSHQIYLTFPAESSFTEDDVAKYFSQFGDVEDVRMPCHQKRMFGFVTFSSPETVATVLSKPNPHFVGGSRVLVKPYREKPKMPNRRFAEDSAHYFQPYADVDSEILSSPRGLDFGRLHSERLVAEEYVRILDRQPPMGFNLARNAEFLPLGNFNSLPHSPTERFLTDDGTNHLNPINTPSESTQENGENGETGLPDSPFSSPVSRTATATIST